MTPENETKKKKSRKAAGLYSEMSENNQKTYDDIMKKSFTRAFEKMSSKEIAYYNKLLTREVERIKEASEKGEELSEMDVMFLAFHTKFKNRYEKIIKQQEAERTSKKQAKIDKKNAKKQAKIDKKNEKIAKKEAKKQAKIDKKNAKKQAKIDRKNEKKAEKLAKKATKEIKKGKIKPTSKEPTIDQTHIVSAPEQAPENSNDDVFLDVEEVKNTPKRPSRKAEGLYDGMSKSNQQIYDEVMQKSFTQTLGDLSPEQVDYMHHILRQEVERIKNTTQSDNMSHANLTANDTRIIALYTKVKNRHAKLFGRNAKTSGSQDISVENQNKALDTLIDRTVEPKTKKGGR